MDLYNFMAGLESEFGGEIEPSEETENKAYLDFSIEPDKDKNRENMDDIRWVQLNVYEHDDGFAIVVDDQTLNECSHDFSVKTVEEAIEKIHSELILLKNQT